MKKVIILLMAVTAFMLCFSCSDSGGSGSGADAEAAEEVAAVMAAASDQMDSAIAEPAASPSKLFSGGPMNLSAGPITFNYNFELGGTATYTYTENGALDYIGTITYDTAVVAFEENNYTINGSIDMSFIYSETGTGGTFGFGFDGDVGINGGSLSGIYAINIEITITLTETQIIYAISGDVDGTAVNISETYDLFVLEA